jgi:sialic acid synthase SpsE
MIKTKFNLISNNSPTYFVADIAANHDGDLDRAKELICEAAKAGANAAKFQNFKAETIVSKKGFNELGTKIAHQSSWDQEVFQVYKNAELPLDWTSDLIECCKVNGIDYFTAVYDLKLIDFFADKMEIYKIGSGDITWREALVRIASKNMPVFLATGASEMREVKDAMSIFLDNKNDICIMQCNTNYTATSENINFLNLRVLVNYAKEFPTAILGLSDHTDGHLSVLAAVSLGAKVIEKHFTDDRSRSGPDHKFSLDPKMWKNMVEDVRQLEMMIGDGTKRVEENEIESQIVQRRSLRFSKDMIKGEIIKEGDLTALRPCPPNGISPFNSDLVLGKKLKFNVEREDLVVKELFES